jgi:histone acetyltransferase
MKLLYPSSHEMARLNDVLLSIKIARHSSCSVCNSCTGLHPPPGITVADDIEANSSLLRDLTQYGSDDDDGSPTAYLLTCACGHSAVEHNADICELDREEFTRRGLVGIRLDELLQVSLCVVIEGGFLCSNLLSIHRYGFSPIFDRREPFDHVLKDQGKLLDFSYVDEDIVSLRKQMHIPRFFSSPSVVPSSPGNVPGSYVTSC